MHESFFSYNLSRPYPYRWFTWVVFGGGLVAAAIFTVINVAADGYILSNVQSTNPNKTTEDVFWFQKKPWSWAAKVATTCQPQTINVQSSLFTDKMAFPYAVQNITQRGPNGSRLTQPSFAYQNVDLSCSITSITMTVINQTSSTSTWLSGPLPLVFEVVAYVSCSLVDDPWDTKFNLKTGLSFNSATSFYSWLEESITTNSAPSVFWGEQLITLYSTTTFPSMPSLIHWSPEDGSYMFADITLNAQYLFYPSAGNMGSIEYNVQVFNGSNEAAGVEYQDATISMEKWINNTHTVNQNVIPVTPTSTQWMDAINGYVKGVYSTVLSDLGQAGQYNMLYSPEAGQALFTQARDIWLSQLPKSPHHQMIQPPNDPVTIRRTL